MNTIYQFFIVVSIMAISQTSAHCSVFSQIEEKMLLNPTGSGEISDKVIIYSRVRNKTIQKAMDSQFNRIQNMMFVNSVIEPDSGDSSYTEDDDCD